MIRKVCDYVGWQHREQTILNILWFCEQYGLDGKDVFQVDRANQTVKIGSDNQSWHQP